MRDGYFRQRAQDVQKPRSKRKQGMYSFLEFEKFVLAGTEVWREEEAELVSLV